MKPTATAPQPPSPLAPVAPMPPRTGWVMTGIRHAILAGQLTAGQPLVEADLARLYGVSKTPVREALKTLAGQGLVRLGDFKGATVTRVDAALVKDVFNVRGLLEPPAVGASVRAGVDLHPAEDLLRRARDTDSALERSVLNREFHRTLYEGCGNELMIEILDGLRERTALISVTLWKSVHSWDDEAEEHSAMLAAALSGDAEEAERLVAAHIEQFAAKCFAQLP